MIASAKPAAVQSKPSREPLTRTDRRPTQFSQNRGQLSVPIFAIAMILIGAFEQYVVDQPYYAKVLWEIGLIGAGFPVVWRTAQGVFRGKFAADVVAS
ncbi:MAG TPA: hypothetical protein VF105_05115, partial [Gemmatimonadaceae bacterium]